MTRRGWIKAGLDNPGKVKALQMFLGMAVVEPRAYTEAIGFRITQAAQQKVSLGALSVWLRKGELEAQDACTAAYDAEAFRQALLDIRRLTQQPLKEFIPTMSTLCAGAGGAFCLVPELPRSGANGAAHWLPDDQALIQMSLRHKWADAFRFSFFHEACHILRHRTQRRIVVDGLGRDPDLTDMEAEADAFASDMLIPNGRVGPGPADCLPRFRGRSASEGTATNANRCCLTTLPLLPPWCGLVPPAASWPRVG